MNNNKFDIRFFTDYLYKHHEQNFKEMPLAVKGSGSSLWIEKKKKIDDEAEDFSNKLQSNNQKNLKNMKYCFQLQNNSIMRGLYFIFEAH